eukprot:scaffold1759_cov213-Skeletonema_marinoi.AAC.2
MALDSDRRASSGYLIAGATTGTEWRGQRGEEDKSLLSFLCPFQFFRKHPKRLSPRFDVMRTRVATTLAEIRDKLCPDLPKKRYYVYETMSLRLIG